jgi:hypothetical protein
MFIVGTFMKWRQVLPSPYSSSNGTFLYASKYCTDPDPYERQVLATVGIITR